MLLTDSSRYGCTSLSYRWSLCLCTLSAAKFSLPLILLTAELWHICVSVTRFSPEWILIGVRLIRVLKFQGNRRALKKVKIVVWCGGGKWWKAFFLPQYPKLLLFFPTCLSRRTARWSAQKVGMWLVPADRVALPRKDRSQQSNLLTALRCVSGQVLLSAIPQVLIYQLSVQTEHRPRLYFCLLL